MKKCIFVLSLTVILLVVSLSSCVQHKEVSKSNKATDLAKVFVELLAEEDFSGATRYFDTTMKRAMSPEKLQQAWKSLIAQMGPFERQLGVKTEKFRQYKIVFVTCEFEEGSLDVKVVFNGYKLISGLFFIPSQHSTEYRPPAYIMPNSFREKEVLVGTGKWALPGTLTLPVGSGPFPAVVLLHGSGPHDRDETIGPNKPFRDLAWGLTSEGIAVLRYEKRTKVHAARLVSAKDSITVKEETIEDALAAVSMLRKMEGIDARKIFVIGHSLGGMLIPRIGVLDTNICGFIVMAGPTRPLEDVIFDQASFLFLLDGTMSESEEAQLREIKDHVAKVKDLKLSTAPSTDLLLGVPCQYWLDLRGYNPPEVARSIRQPMLILQGQRDYQVTMEDFKGWKDSLLCRNDVKFKLYPKLNHLFMKGKGKSTPSEYQTPGHVAKIVIHDIADWIRKQQIKGNS